LVALCRPLETPAKRCFGRRTLKKSENSSSLASPAVCPAPAGSAHAAVCSAQQCAERARAQRRAPNCSASSVVCSPMRCTNLMSATGVCASSISRTRAGQGAGVCVPVREFDLATDKKTHAFDWDHVERRGVWHRSLLHAWRGVRVVLRQRLQQRLQLLLEPLLLLARLAAHVQRALLVLQRPHLGV